MSKAAHDDPAPPTPQPAGGLITIRWWRLPEPFESEFDWEYRPIPPIPDELGKRLLGEVADRLSPAEHAEPGHAKEADSAAEANARQAKPAREGD
jgi:hypothetical protein